MNTSKDKIKKICEHLKKETLEPAQMEASEILQRAKEEAAAIVASAREEAVRLRGEAKEAIEQRGVVFEASLKQTCKLAIEALKQTIVEKFFQPELGLALKAPLQEKEVIAKLLGAVIQGIEKMGIDGDITAYVASIVPASEVNALMAPKVLQRLKDHGVLVGSFSSGIKIKIEKENITLDLTDQALKELVASYASAGFRTFLFA